MARTSGHYSVHYLFGLSAAFDTVDHPLVFKELHCLGLCDLSRHIFSITTPPPLFLLSIWSPKFSSLDLSLTYLITS